MYSIYVLHKAYIWRHFRLLREEEDAWRRSMCHEAAQMMLTKLGLAYWAVYWIVAHNSHPVDMIDMAREFHSVFFSVIDVKDLPTVS
jgi:hypothetical protein